MRVRITGRLAASKLGRALSEYGSLIEKGFIRPLGPGAEGKIIEVVPERAIRTMHGGCLCLLD